MNKRWPWIVVGTLLATGAGGGDLNAVAGDDGAGRTVAEITSNARAFVLFTSPRLAQVGPQLRLLAALRPSLPDDVVLAAVVYGQDDATLAKLREGTPFPVVAGRGEVPPEVTGKDRKLPFVAATDKRGNVKNTYGGVPDAVEAAAMLGYGVDVGPAGPPVVNSPLPNLMVATGSGGAVDVRAAAGGGDAVLFAFDAQDPARGRYLTSLQNLADDVETYAVLPLMVGGNAALAAKLAEAQQLELEILLGGPLARHLIVGDLHLPVLIKTSGGVVTGIKERASVPDRLSVAAEESEPAAEGPPVELAVIRAATLVQYLLGDAPPSPSFDASGRYVVFSGRFEDGDDDHLYEVTAAGAALRQISRAPADDCCPAAAPNDSRIVFLSGRDGANELWTCERRFGEFTRLTRSGGAYGPAAYSPDGAYLVAARRSVAGTSSNFDLWLMDGRGRRPRPVAETFYDEVDPAFSADGGSVYFASNRRGSFDIYVSDKKGNRRRRLTDAAGDDRMPACSPDGKYIVYANRDDRGVFKLWVMNADGSSKKPLTDGPGNDVTPRFSPDGRYLVYASDRTGFWEIIKLTFAVPPDYEAPRPPRPIASRQ